MSDDWEADDELDRMLSELDDDRAPEGEHDIVSHEINVEIDRQLLAETVKAALPEESRNADDSGEIDIDELLREAGEDAAPPRYQRSVGVCEGCGSFAVWERRGFDADRRYLCELVDTKGVVFSGGNYEGRTVPEKCPMRERYDVKRKLKEL